MMLSGRNRGGAVNMQFPYPYNRGGRYGYDYYEDFQRMGYGGQRRMGRYGGMPMDYNGRGGYYDPYRGRNGQYG